MISYNGHEIRAKNSIEEGILNINDYESGSIPSFSISLRENVSAKPTNYKVYSLPTRWTIVSMGSTRIVNDPNSLWSVISLIKKERRADLLCGFAFWTTVASIVLLACKLWGSVKAGHWGHYLATISVSGLTTYCFAKIRAITQFEIANRVYSVLKHPEDSTEITRESKLFLNRAEYVM